MRGLRRLTGVAGLATAALISVGFFGGTPPAVDDSGQTVLTYAAGHRTFLLAFFFLFGIGACGALLFFAGLRRVLAVPARPEHDVWPLVMFGSAIAVFGLGIAAQACVTAVARRQEWAGTRLRHGSR